MDGVQLYGAIYFLPLSLQEFLEGWKTKLVLGELYTGLKQWHKLQEIVRFKTTTLNW